jgi:hypothetical protein
VNCSSVRPPIGGNGDAGDKYIGLDLFDRVVDQRWLKTSTGVATDRFQYAYDRDGNRLYRNSPGKGVREKGSGKRGREVGSLFCLTPAAGIVNFSPCPDACVSQTAAMSITSSIGRSPVRPCSRRTATMPPFCAS